MQDILTQALSHSWGTKPAQKRREKEYNAEYYRKHKEKWAEYRRSAEADVEQANLNIEGAQKRVDNAQRDVNDLTNKYANLRKSYQLFLEGAQKVGINDPQIKRWREQYQKDLENAANDLAKAQETLSKEKKNLGAQKRAKNKAESISSRTTSQDPYRARSIKRSSSYAENEASKRKLTTKSQRVKNRANVYAANEAAKLQESKINSEKQKTRRAEIKKKAQDDLFVAKQHRDDIKKNMQDTSDMLNRLNKSGANKSGAKTLADRLVKQNERLKNVNTDIKDLEDKIKKYS